jgi:siroheme decarboxylase
MASLAQPKLRSRQHGAAIPLDDLDRKLLNLMQGSFPLDPRPYAHIARAAGLGQPETMARIQRLLDQRIIREITPIFDTRALGYRSMLVAARVDPEHPQRAAAFVNTHPGVTHNYLRSHEFNLWFTLAVEPDSPLGLDGTLEIIAAKAPASSIRQLPTLRMFKIRMDLEMEGGTEALANPGAAEPPRELDPVALQETDVRVVQAAQGPMPVVERPYAPAAARLGLSEDDLLARLQSLAERRALRRVAAILFHRRAGFSANGMGVWRVPPERVEQLGPEMASTRGVSHCYERPTYEDWPYSLFTMAHGRSKEECDAVLDAIAERTGITERATLYSSTEYKKIRMLYFTPAFRDWEREHAGIEHPPDSHYDPSRRPSRA